MQGGGRLKNIRENREHFSNFPPSDELTLPEY